MEQETIEKAAKTKLNYTWSNPILTAEISIHTGKDSPQTKTTMKQDAAVWHDARKEVPEKCKPVLTERKTGRKSGIFSVNVSAGMESCPLSWARWAYIDDLLPERKEEAK